MTEELVRQLMTESLLLILKVSLPVLLVGLTVGLLVGLFQATTQIQEMTLSFIPKIISIFLVIFFLGQWMLVSIREFTVELFTLISTL